MITKNLPQIHTELERRVRARTGSRLRNLEIKVSQDGVVLLGNTNTFYIKQLASHGVRDVLPNISLNNQIVVS